MHQNPDVGVTGQLRQDRPFRERAANASVDPKPPFASNWPDYGVRSSNRFGRAIFPPVRNKTRHSGDLHKFCRGCRFWSSSG